MIETQYCTPAPARGNKTPRHMRPNGNDVKAAAYHEHRAEGSLSKGQMTVMSVLWRINMPLTRKQIVANCPPSHQLPLSSVCGRVNELIAKELVDCNETAFDKDTRKHVQALVLSEKGQAIYSASIASEPQSGAGKPTKPKRSHRYSKNAAILCGDYDFNCYVYEHEKKLSEKLSRSRTSDFDGMSLHARPPECVGKSKDRPIVSDHDAELTAAWLRTQCCIQSRAELDSDELAREKFHEVVWDFAMWVSKRGRPAHVLKLIGAQQ